VEWVKKWLDPRERLIEIAKVMRRYPRMVKVIRQRQVGILHPYMIEVHVAKDGSEACLSLTPPKAFCTQNGSVKETKLELEFKRYGTCEDKTKRGIQTKGTVGIRHGGERIREDTLGEIDYTATSKPTFFDSPLSRPS
jgi:hypothetical protein